jgi:DNA polymerase III alpha subunit (gram-positive type)
MILLNLQGPRNDDRGGRGSAGGSLVAYLLDIIKIDPMVGLLFEKVLKCRKNGFLGGCDKY